MADAHTKKRMPIVTKPMSGQVAAITALYAIAYIPLTSQLETQISLLFYFLIAIRLAALRWPAIEPSRWLLVPLTLGAVLNVYHAHHTIVGQDGGSALLASMLALKLLETRQVRDIRLAAMLFGFLAVTQFLFDKSLETTLFLTVLLLLDVAILADLCRRAPRPIRQSLALSLRLAVQAVPLTLILFVLFPRLDVPLWKFVPPEDRAKTGVKPWLELGSVSELVADRSLAFRVRFDGPIQRPEDLYWRGPVLWNAYGRRWLPAERGQFHGLQVNPATATDLIAYEVSLEPSGQRFLFALDLPSGTTEKGAEITHDFQVLATKRIRDKRVYQMTSALTYNTGELSLEEEVSGLQLPENVTERMRALVDRWKRQTSNSAEFVEAGLAFIEREPFYYTLQPPEYGTNPADEFLFETRRGFCEHYASSFVLLMRLGGIPSRVVLGYLGGELNPMGGHLIVRQSDAHAWTEVWLEGRGWVRVDPTAAIASHRIERSDILSDLASGSPVRFRGHAVDELASLVHRLRLLADAIDEGWRHWVVELDRKRQLNMLEWFGLGHLREYGLALFMGIGAAAALGLLMLALVHGGHATLGSPMERLYRRFCRHLGRLGFEHRISEGPIDYGRRVAGARPDLAKPVEAFVKLYASMRYGSVPANRQNLDHLQAHIAKVRGRKAAQRPADATD